MSSIGAIVEVLLQRHDFTYTINIYIIIICQIHEGEKVDHVSNNVC